MPKPFVHLHLHSEYSLLDGFCRIEKLAAHAKEVGATAVALTDHGNLHGAVAFTKAMKEVGVKPILGCEVYRTKGDHRDKAVGEEGKEKFNHLTLLAANNTGWQNLSRLVSKAHLDGFYYKPRVDDALLQEHSEGIIALTGCMAGRLSQAILAGDMSAAQKEATFLRDTYGQQNLFFEVHQHGIEGQKELGNQLWALSKQFGCPVVAANDVHYLRKEDALIHDALLALQTGKQFNDATRMRMSEHEYYYKTHEEMSERFSGLEQALDNTLLVAERCDVTFDQSLRYPSFSRDQDFDTFAHIRSVAESQFGKKLPDTREYRQRLETELGVIEKTGFSSYFAIVADLVGFAKSNNIPVGPGRGSAAGSLLAYSMGITDLDPMKHGLLFERFLNPDRVSPPDIDMDFCEERRGEVISYLREKYGEDRVSHIVTFTTLAPRSSIKDACRVFGVSVGDANRLSSMVPDNPKDVKPEFFTTDPGLREEAQKNANVDAALKLAGEIMGLPRNPGVHASGIVISPTPTAENIPLSRTSDGAIVTQWDMREVEQAGFLKLDVLGLRTCTVIERARQFVKAQGVDLDLDKIPLDDPKTAEIYVKGNAFGVFQVKDATIKSFCMKAPVKSMEDFTAATSLCRPGPMDLIPSYLDRMRGKEESTPVHPLVKDVTANTCGLLIYQEQVMQSAQILAGYSLAQADLLRRAMGKKDAAKMEKERSSFIDGCQKANNIPAEKATEIFGMIEKFAGYGFNKSHAAAYALLSWQTAYLKAHHPAAFYAANMSSELNNVEKVGSFLMDAKDNGVVVKGPDVNKSGVMFEPKGDEVYFGLAGIKGVGAKTAEEITKAAPFAGFDDFTKRMGERGLKKNELEKLTLCGALDAFGERQAIFDRLGTVTLKSKKKVEAASGGMDSLFGEMNSPGAAPAAKKEPFIEGPKMDTLMMFTYEQELLGAAFCRNPASDYVGRRQDMDAIPLRDLKPMNGKMQRVVALVSEAEEKNSKKSGKKYMKGVLRDASGRVDFMCFKDTMLPQLTPGAVVCLRGFYDEEGQFKPQSLEPVVKKTPSSLTIKLDINTTAKESLEKIRSLTVKGEVPITLDFGNGKTVKAGEDVTFPMDFDAESRLFQIDGVRDVVAHL